MNQRTMGIRGRIVAVVLLVLLPVAGKVIWDAESARRDVLSRAEKDARDVWQRALRREAEIVASARATLTVLSHAWGKRGLDEPACRELASAIVAGDARYAAISFIDPRGLVLCGSFAMSSPIRADDRAFFRRAMETRAFAIGDFQIGKATGRASLGFALPFLGPDGAIAAIGYVGIEAGWLGNALVSEGLPEGDTFLLFDANGTIVTRQPNHDAWVGKNVADSRLFESAALHGSGATFEEVGLDGIIPKALGIDSARGIPRAAGL